jgi:hypothetical protein
MTVLTAMCWKDKREVYMLSNIHPSPANDNIRDQYGYAIKPHIVKQYNTHMGMLTKVTECQTAVTYVLVHGNGRKKLFFHLLDLFVLNAFLVHKSFGGEVSQKQFRTKLIRELVQNVDMTTTRVQRGRSSSSAPQLSCLEAQKFNHWPVKGTKKRCVVCSLRKKWSTSSYLCLGCVIALRVSPCFEEYHTKTNI